MYYKISPLKNIILFFSTTLFLWSCGDSNDTTSNVANDISSTSNEVSFVAISSSSDAFRNYCLDGETIKDINGITTYFCFNGQWKTVIHYSQPGIIITSSSSLASSSNTTPQFANTSSSIAKSTTQKRSTLCCPYGTSPHRGRASSGTSP